MSFSPSEADRTDIGLRAWIGLKLHIQQVLVRMQDARPASAPLRADSCLPAAPPAGGLARPGSARPSPAGRARRSRWPGMSGGTGVGDGDLAQLEARPEVEGCHDLQRRVGRGGVDDQRQGRVIQRVAADRGGDGGLVVAEAMQRGFESAGVLPCPFGQCKTSHRQRIFAAKSASSCPAVRHPGRIAGRFQRHGIRLRVGRPRASA